VQTRYGQRQVQNVTIADETKSMVLALWQQHIDKVKAQHFYTFENLISTFFAVIFTNCAFIIKQIAIYDPLKIMQEQRLLCTCMFYVFRLCVNYTMNRKPGMNSYVQF
jgi:hypothetical protein